MKRIIIGTLLTCTLFASTQAASPTVKKQPWRDAAGNTHTFKSLGRLASKEVRWNWRPPEWTIVFGPGRDGYLGMTYPHKKEVDIWIRPEHSPKSVADTLVHELAHVFDTLYLNDALSFR